MRYALAPKMVVLALCAAVQLQCSGGKSVVDLYDFDSTKRVQVLAKIRIVGEDSARAVTEAPTDFLLSAFASDNEDLKIPLARGQEPAQLDLPVTVSGSSTSVSVVAEVPASVLPDPDGHYAMRFVATPQAPRAAAPRSPAPGTGGPATRAAMAADESALQALAGGIRVGTRPADNKVELSVATTLALRLVASHEPNLAAAQTHRVYQKIRTLLANQQAILQQQVAASAALTPSGWLNVMDTALKASAVANVELQGTIATNLTRTQGAGQKPVATSEVLGTFAQVMATWSATASTQLADSATVAAQVLPRPLATTVSEANASSLQAGSLAASRVVFVDTDASEAIAGDVVVTTSWADGITGYRVYFGGDAPEQGRTKLLGTAELVGKEARLPVAAQVPPPGSTALWIWPCVGEHELPSPYRFTLPVELVIAEPEDPRPGQVANVQVADRTFSSLTLSWDPVPRATGYRVYRQSSSPLTRTGAHTNEAASTTSLHANLSPDKDYFFRVSAVREDYEGMWSDELALRTGALPVPGVPTVHDRTTARASLQWPGQAGIDEWVVYWSTTTPVTKQHPHVVVPGPTLAQAGLSAGLNYHYAVAARFQGSFESKLSAEASALIKHALTPPATVSAVSQKSQNAVVVGWKAVAGADYYCVYRSTVSPVDAHQDTSHAVYQGNAYRFEDVTADQDYFYAVKTVIDGQKSEPSDEIRVTLRTLDPLSDRQDAVAIIGQADMQSTAAGLSASEFGPSSPLAGVTVDHQDRLWVSDGNNNRVLSFSATPLPTGANIAANFALNAADLTSRGAGGLGNSQMSLPQGIAASGGGLALVDGDNRRVLLYSPLPATGPTAAASLLGLPAFGVDVPAVVSDEVFFGPSAVASVGGRVLVADTQANRVLVFEPRVGRSATVVLGQPDMGAGAANNGGVSAKSLRHPTGVWSDGERVLVYDAGNARILGWNTFPGANFQAADFVLGQTTMTNATGLADNGSDVPSAARLGGLVPDLGIYLPAVHSNGTQIIASDPGNHRVLVWGAFPASNGEAAAHVLGQPNFTTGVAAAAQPYSFGEPTAVYIGGDAAYVVDNGLRRVSVFAAHHD